ncbi:MAG: prepilin-type N-terminal cleavage/methylation domain-containing protein [Planctomycetota bacterium]
MRPIRHARTANAVSPLRSYTLIELLVVVMVMGIAAAIVAPAIGGADPLRVQTSVRAIASDIMFAQSDAVAYQERRAVVFDLENNRYSVVEVLGNEIDPIADAVFRVGAQDQRYVVELSDLSDDGARLLAVDFDESSVLIFDELGGPVLDATSDEAGSGGFIDVGTEETRFRVSVEPYTGRVTVIRLTGE